MPCLGVDLVQSRIFHTQLYLLFLDRENPFTPFGEWVFVKLQLVSDGMFLSTPVLGQLIAVMP
jgi:hypothetical protein